MYIALAWKAGPSAIRYYASRGRSAPTLLGSGNTIRRWIIKEFERQKLQIKELVTERGQIHISFDLWSSPNGKGLAGIFFHFFDKDLKVCNLLAGMRRAHNSHSGRTYLKLSFRSFWRWV